MRRAGIIKQFLASTANYFGVQIATTDRLGFDAEQDIRRLTAQSPPAIIFDVGGNFGQTARRYATAFPTATIHTFEPVPVTYAHLLKAVRSHSRIRPHNIAFGRHPGTANIYLGASAGSNSLIDSPSLLESTPIIVDTVDTFMAAHQIDAIDVLKIDVEGYEREVLAGATRSLTSQLVRYIFAECVFADDPDAPHTRLEQLNTVLYPAGFCIVACYAESFCLRSGCALGNVLYANRSRLPTKVPGRVRNIY